MSDIDFLPASYRQMTVHRKANVWRLLAGGLFVAMIGVSGLYQHLLRRDAMLSLARTGPEFERAELLVAEQGELKRQLQMATDEAELFAYLRHPWPATQVLAAALAPLPDCITLHQIRLFNGETIAAAASGAPAKPQKKQADTEPASKRDLQRLREENDSRPRVLILSGTTTDTAALQQYLLALGGNELFVKTELASLESESSDRLGSMHFTARLVVRPGYGQPGGPSIRRFDKPATAATAKTAVVPLSKNTKHPPRVSGAYSL